MTDSATGVAEGSISKNEQKRQLKVFIIIIFAVVIFDATQGEKLCLRDVFGYIFFWLNLPCPQLYRVTIFQLAKKAAEKAEKEKDASPNPSDSDKVKQKQCVVVLGIF